jgi:hypothetical protein
MTLLEVTEFFASDANLSTVIGYLEHFNRSRVNEDTYDDFFTKFFMKFIKTKTFAPDISPDLISNFFDVIFHLIDRIDTMTKQTIKSLIRKKYSNVSMQLKKLPYKTNPAISNKFEILFGKLSVNNAALVSSTNTITNTIREMTKAEELQLCMSSPNFSNSTELFYPCDKQYMQSFTKTFESLGEKKDTGAFLEGIDKLRIVYKSALFYYFKKIMDYNIRDFRRSSPAQKFYQLFTGHHRQMSLCFISYIISTIKVEISPSSTNEFDRMVKEWIDDLPLFNYILKYLQEEKDFDKVENKINIILTVKSDYDLKRTDIILDQNDTFTTIRHEIPIGILNKICNIFGLTEQQMINITDVPKNKEYFNNVLHPGDKDFDPYWFQRECINDTVTLHKNLLLCGPTGGGKTHMLMFIIAKLITSLIGGTNQAIIACCFPTDPLVYQTYANMIVSFPSLRDNIVVLTKSFANKIETMTNTALRSLILIGTPKELRDYLVIRNPTVLNVNNEIDFKEKIESYTDNVSFQEINCLVIDEVHTLSRDYSCGINTINEIKSIEELIGCVDTTSGQIISASATLSAESQRRLVEKISLTMKRNSSDTPLAEVQIRSYNLEDIGAKEKPEFYRYPDLPQEKYPVCVSQLGAISKAENSSEITRINVDPKFLLNLLLTAKAEKVLPIALFFMSESHSINHLASLIKYFEEQTLKSEWLKMKLEYKNMETIKSFDELKEIYLLDLDVKIKEYISINNSELTIPAELFKDIIIKYNHYSEEKISSFKYSADLYAFLYEFINLKEGRAAFLSDVHPFFNFGSIKADLRRFDIRKPNQQLTEFGEELESQGVNIENCSTLINLLTNSFKYGIGLVTSSIPVAFQLEISKILAEIKKNNSSEVGAVFCDYQMSMGVDYSFLSIAIILMELGTILKSIFEQMNGRGGRPSKDRRKHSELPRAITFTVNVTNALSFPETENLSFDTTDIKSSFYSGESLYNNVILLMINFETIKLQLINKRNFSDNIFFENNVLFPGLEHVTERHLKYYHMKRLLKEMYDIFKVAAPSVAKNYIEPLFTRFQYQCYNTLMSNM